MYTYDQHIFIMTAIEDDHFAFTWHHFVDAPQIIMCELFRGRLLETGHIHAGGIHAREDVPDGAIFAGSIHGLQDDQDLVLCSA